MGYRSQVCIGLTDDAARLLRTLLEHVPESHELQTLIQDAEKQRFSIWTDQHKDPLVDCEDKLYWDSVKWYDGYDCVGFLETFLNDHIVEEDYRFVRVGEDSDDLEERGEYWESEIYINRSISW